MDKGESGEQPSEISKEAGSFQVVEEKQDVKGSYLLATEQVEFFEATQTQGRGTGRGAVESAAGAPRFLPPAKVAELSVLPDAGSPQNLRQERGDV